METKRRAKAPLPMSSFRGGRVGGASHPSLPTTHGWNRARRKCSARGPAFDVRRTARPSDRTPHASGVVAAPGWGEQVGEPRTASLTGLGGGYQDLRERPEVFDGCVIRHVDPRARATLAARAHIATTGMLWRTDRQAPRACCGGSIPRPPPAAGGCSHGRACLSAGRVGLAGPVPFHGPTWSIEVPITGGCGGSSCESL